MNIELHLIQGGVDKGPLPSFTSANISPVFCDYGGFSFDYPRDGKRYSLLDGKDEVEIVPWINGVAYPQFGGLAQEISGDDVAEGAVQSYTGRGYLALLDEARVYPFNWPSYDPKAPSWVIVNGNAGSIMKAQIAAAQARGSLPGITTATFSNTTDSNGVAWTKQISFELKPGVMLTDVLKSLYENQMVEFVMYGRDLRLYNPGTLGTDRTVQAKPLTFRKGRDIRDSPRKISSRDVRTVILAAGKEDAGVYQEEADATAIAGRRRIEGYVSNGNVSDTGTLDAFAAANLAVTKNAKMEKTHGLEFARPTSPQPGVDFGAGDWAYSDVGKGLEKLRIKQWVLSVESEGKVSGSVVLNDLIAELEERLAQRINGIVGGSTITGESRVTDVVPTEVVDGLAPAAPTGIGLSSAAYMDSTGQVFAQVSASWLAPTANTDGTVLEDLAGYRLQYKYSTESTAWRVSDVGNVTSTTWSPVTPGVTVNVQVQAYDKYGNSGPWSATASVATGFDATPPEAPSTPSVNSYLGLLRVTWDGKTASGAAVAPDQEGVEVHVSTVSGFTPSATTLVDFLSAAGVSYYRSGYFTTMYAKLVAVDYSGNKSTPSAQGSSFSVPVVDTDIFDGAVGTAKLADLAVTNAKINDLAVNDAKIGSVNVGKLTAGIMTAEVTVSGRLATALTGARREMNSIGFQAWDSSNNLTISLDGVDNLLTGRYRTALTGRRLEMGSAGLQGEINFYAPDGKSSFVRSYTEGTGIEALQMGVEDGQNSLWNRINFNSDRWTNMRSERMDFYYTTVFRKDGGTGQFTIREGTTTGAANTLVRAQFTDSGIQLYRKITGGTTPAGRLAISITDGGTTHIWKRPGNSFRVYDDVNGVNEPRLNISDTDIWWEWPNETARMLFRPASTGSGGNDSPGIQMVNASNGGVYIRGYSDAGGSNNPRLEIRDVVDASFAQCYASGFPVQSSREVKRNIEDITFTATEKLRPVKVKKFQRRRWIMDGEGKPVEGPPGPVEIGVEAEELPAEMRLDTDSGPFWDLAPSLALVIAMLKEMDVRLTKVEEKK